MIWNRRELLRAGSIAAAVVGLGFRRLALALPATKHLKDEEWATLRAAMSEIAPGSEKGAEGFLQKSFDDEFPRFRIFPKKVPFGRASGIRFLPYYRKFIGQLEAAALETHAKSFASLESKRRFQILEEFSKQTSADVGYKLTGIPPVEQISKGELFDMARRHCLQSFFADPFYGGNIDYAGWKSVGHTCHMNYPDKPETCPPHLLPEG